MQINNDITPLFIVYPIHISSLALPPTTQVYNIISTYNYFHHMTNNLLLKYRCQYLESLL